MGSIAMDRLPRGMIALIMAKKKKKKKKQKNPAQASTSKRRRRSMSQIAFVIFAVLIVASFLVSLVAQGF